MPKTIKVKHNEKTISFPYPTKPVKDFLEVLRTDFKINASAPLILVDKCELSASSTLEQLNIADDSVLTLKLDTESTTFTIRVQMISGTMLSFSFDNTATLTDLYNKICEEIKSATTCPLLFNHRMHIFNSAEFSTQPLVEFLPLTTIKEENIPHFYLFEHDNERRTRQYDYTKNLKDIFLKSDLWQPKSGEQSNDALLVYLNTMYALTRVFLTRKDVDFDSVHNVYMPQFLIVLRRYLFSPACLAFKHAIEGALFKFEKSLLSEAFFHLFRKLLPSSIPDDELFSYTPFVLCWIFANGDHASTESACYESIEFNKRLHDSTHNNVGEASAADDYFAKPVRLLNNKVVDGAANHFVLMEYKEAQAKNELTTSDYQQQPDIVGLLMFLRHYDKTVGSHDSLERNSLFEQFSTDYTFWLPDDKKNLLSIGNVSEQKENLKTLSDDEVEEIKQKLSNNDLYSIFTFADPSALSKYNHAQLVLLKSNNIVYITNATKSDENLFLCFDPSNGHESVDKSEVATKYVLAQRANFVIRENAADIRKIEQINYVLFDISGSMDTAVGSDGNQYTLLELSKMAFGAWRDRLVSYRLAHAIGLIYFGTDDRAILTPSSRFLLQNNITGLRSTSRGDGVVVQCDLTRDFTSFERALGEQPGSGGTTPLYDAIDIAIQRIQSFREEMKTKLSPTCKELILCLTDGGDNCSRVSKADVLKKLLDNNIVFDAVNFESSSSDVLVDFCEKTKGYYYTDIQHNQDSMLNLFELEATISVKDREENVCGKVKRPQRRQPKDFDKPAIATKQARIGDGRVSNISLRRIMLEIKNLNKSELSTFDLFVSKENLFFWKVIMHGETGTSYADGRWLLFIEFPTMYPDQPPEIRFITKIYHCNINDDGKICHDVLSTAWSQKTSMYSVLMEILRLLREPNADDALSSVKGAQLKASRENYDNTIIEWKKEHASASVEQLMEQYQLE